MKRITPSPKQLDALKLIAAGKFYPDLVKEEDGWCARWRGVGVDNNWVDECVRSSVITPISEDAEDARYETLHDAWMMALRSRTGRVCWDDQECENFARELKAWHSSVSESANSVSAITFEFLTDPFRLITAIPKRKARLRSLGQATYVYSPLRNLRVAGECLSAELTHVEAEHFLKVGARSLIEAGYEVKGVLLASPITAECELKDSTPAKTISAKLIVRVAGEVVSAEEIRFLLEQNSSLVFFRNRWIEVDRSILKEALRALERQNPSIALATAIAFASGIGAIGRLEIEQVASRGWIRGLLNSMRETDKLTAVIPHGFNGELRDYQVLGVRWLKFLTDNGFGALLADDMGLGKTIQTIAWILATQRKSPVLIVAPLTLITNWVREFKQFAPQLKVYAHYGDGRSLSSGFFTCANKMDVVITSYKLLVKDYPMISGVRYEALVIDEAQMVKNADTQAARALRALMPPKRIALTGTPIENSLIDIWSIESLLNPGFLGERKTFIDRYVKPTKLDPLNNAARKLAHALEPFVLRRLKSDPKIAATLGEKHEIKEYCQLSPSELYAYESALADYRLTPRAQGDVFALLNRLKLICDGASKLELLCSLLTSIFEVGESALIFTQYAKVGDWLKKELEARFSRQVPFLHGELGVAQREREIARFNRAEVPTAFVLSLKAGGFGLNLTKASHVIHFDRWWNPAVENQATDRAHRIGQTKTVIVHILITQGTLEEHIDEILMRKATLEGLLTAGDEFERLVMFSE